MGIDAHGIRFLEYVLRANGPMNETLTVGHQALDVPEREVRDYLGLTASRQCAVSSFIDDLLAEEFGATSVASLDASSYEGATYVRDLNLELEPNFPQFDTIIDAGTLEHVFDVRTGFGNINRCCKVGGQILHILPANNFVGHGFYQFSPEFFYSLYNEARGFTDTEVYLADLGRLNAWWKVVPPTGVSRSTAMCSHETYTLVRTRKISEPAGTLPVQQSDYVSKWVSHEETSVQHSSLQRRTFLGNLSNLLPGPTRAMLVSPLTPRFVQARRRFSTGIHSRNAVLNRVSVPPPRHRRSAA
jgi:SAM-dependent methyltransferase